MRVLLVLLFTLAPLAGKASEQEVQRALIQRDQQSAEFDRKGLEGLHARQLREVATPLHPDPEVAKQLRPYQRQQMARERASFKSGSDPKPEKSGSDPDLKPLPLPGGPRHGVEPVALPGLGR